MEREATQGPNAILCYIFDEDLLPNLQNETFWAETTAFLDRCAAVGTRVLWDLSMTGECGNVWPVLTTTLTVVANSRQHSGAEAAALGSPRGAGAAGAAPGDPAVVHRGRARR